MATDPYAVCPCGSGKKLKFCCGEILPELQRALRTRENQPEAALKLLRELYRRHPGKESILRELTITLLELKEADEAKAVIREFLQRRPDDPTGLLTLAEISLQTDGFDASRRLIHRAFQLCAKAHPAHVAFLAATVAKQMASTGRYLAAREHLAMAVRFAEGDRQRSLVMELLRFEGHDQIPGPFRSAWNLLPITCSDAAVQADARARKLSYVGCWEPASILYNRLADQYPTDGTVWFNLGLCQAWDGRVTEAAASLHHAATLLGDFEQAVESEALAQLFDLSTSKDRYATVSVRLPVRSVSELLTRLDGHPTIVRQETHDHSECNHGDGVVHAAEMILLNKAVTAADLQSTQDLAESIADLDVYDMPDASEDDLQDSESGSCLEVTCNDSMLEEVLAQLRSLAGDLITSSPDRVEPTVQESQCKFAQPFDRNPYCPVGVSRRKFREVVRGLVPIALQNWLESPTALLNGKTPLEAAADESLRTKLAASLIVMQSYAARYDQAPDLTELRQRLNLPPRGTLEIPASVPIAAMPCVQYDRLQIGLLTDQQLAEFCNRCSIVGQQLLVRAALTEVQTRPRAMAELGTRRVYLMLAAIARDELNEEQSIAYLQQARAQIEPGQEAFRQHLEMDVRELTFRLDDPSDEALKPLLHRFRDKYLHKIPEIEDVIREQLDIAGCSHLVSELTGGLTAVTASGSSLWTPDQGSAESDEPVESGSRLWLPGQ